MSSNPCNWVHGLLDEGLVWLIGAKHMPVGCITPGPKSVARTMGAASLRRVTITSADQPPLPRLYSATALRIYSMMLIHYYSVCSGYTLTTLSLVRAVD